MLVLLALPISAFPLGLQDFGMELGEARAALPLLPRPLLRPRPRDLGQRPAGSPSGVQLVAPEQTQ